MRAGRGIEIWSRLNEDQAFELARFLDPHVAANKKSLAFLLLFDDPARPAVTDKVDKYGLKNFRVAVPRSSTKQLMTRADPTGKAITFVFFQHEKHIKAVWSFAPGALTKERQEAIGKEAEKFLKPHDAGK